MLSKRILVPALLVTLALPAAAADFSEESPRIRKGLKALGQIGAITIHDREEGGHRRISLHFQTR